MRPAFFIQQKHKSVVAASLQAFAFQYEVVAHGAPLIAGGRVHQTLADGRFLDGAHHAVGQGIQNVHVLRDMARVNPGDQPFFADVYKRQVKYLSLIVVLMFGLAFF